jgi:hypothetical protein
VSSTTKLQGIPPKTLKRLLDEGFGPGAWHGPDLAAAISDVTPDLAYRRPAAGRHNIAEIALHHAWVIRNVVSQLTGRDPERFPLQGEDWFTIESADDLKWPEVVRLLNAQQQSLVAAVTSADLQSGENDPFDVILGATCHAVYHAGQIQLVKRLIEG